MSDERHKYGIRIRPDLREKLVQLSADNSRSLSEEVSRIIEQHFDRKVLLEEVRNAVAQGAAERPLVGEYGRRIETNAVRTQ